MRNIERAQRGRNERAVIPFRTGQPVRTPAPAPAYRAQSGWLTLLRGAMAAYNLIFGLMMAIGTIALLTASAGEVLPAMAVGTGAGLLGLFAFLQCGAAVGLWTRLPVLRPIVVLSALLGIGSANGVVLGLLTLWLVYDDVQSGR